MARNQVAKNFRRTRAKIRAARAPMRMAPSTTILLSATASGRDGIRLCMDTVISQTIVEGSLDASEGASFQFAERVWPD